MKSRLRSYLALFAWLLVAIAAGQAQDPLPSWNNGAAKQSILDFVKVTTDSSSAKFVPPEQRIATFDQDGTLWVEHPMYTQVVYCLDRVPAVVKAKPELATGTIQNRLVGRSCSHGEAVDGRPPKIFAATLSGMSVDEFQAEVKQWLDTARDPRWKRPYTELTYQPMVELLKYLRANGYKTYIVTGGGQDLYAFTPNRYTASHRSRWSGPPGAPATAMTAAAGRFSPKSQSCYWTTITPANQRAFI